MTWKDRLQDASFRGVPFKVEEESAGTGRRVETHEYPNRDKPYKPLPVPGILQQKKRHRCISASLLAEWRKATEQARQRVMPNLLPNQRL